MQDPTRQGDVFDPASIIYIDDGPALKDLVDLMPDAREIVIDLETTGLDEHATEPVPARIVIASITLPLEGEEDRDPQTFIVSLSHPEAPTRGIWRSVMTTLARGIRDSGRPITNANLGFDMRWIEAHTGVDLTDQFSWDTQLSSHLLDENESTKLKVRAAATFGIDRWDDNDLSSPGAAERVPFYDLAIYAARDTYWTWRLAELHRSIMDQEPGEPARWPESPEEEEDYRLGDLAKWCAMPTGATLTKISQRGLLLDTEWVDDYRAKLRQQRETTLAALETRYGTLEGEPSFASGSHWFQEWTGRAVEAGDLQVMAMTPTGRPQWSKGVLTRQARAGSEAARLLLDHRQAVKLDEFLRSWLEYADENSLVHSTYHAGRVVSGRLSSSNPNLQQCSKGLKPAFIPRPGYVLAEMDFSQIELRVAAFVAGCTPMIDAYRQGRDLHIANASRSDPDEAIRTAKAYLRWLGLPPTRMGAEILEGIRNREGAKTFEGKVLALSRTESFRSEWARWAVGKGVVLPDNFRQPKLGTGQRQYLDGYWRMAGRPFIWNPGPEGDLGVDEAVSVVSSTDAHRLTEVSGVAWKPMRQKGKATGFGFIYGMGAAHFAEYAETSYGAHFTDEEAEHVRDSFFGAYPELVEWHARQETEARRWGQVVSPIGRVRRLPDVFSSDPYTASRAARMAINAPVQGFASDLMQIAAARICGTMPGTTAIPGVHPVGTVHDSLVVEVLADDWKRLVARCMRIMIDPNPILKHMGCELTVPLSVEAEVGTRWGLSDVGIIA